MQPFRRQSIPRSTKCNSRGGKRQPCQRGKRTPQGMPRNPNIALGEGVVDRVINLEGSLVVVRRGCEFRFDTSGITLLGRGTTSTDRGPVHPFCTTTGK